MTNPDPAPPQSPPASPQSDESRSSAVPGADRARERLIRAVAEAVVDIQRPTEVALVQNVIATLLTHLADQQLAPMRDEQGEVVLVHVAAERRQANA